MTEGAVVAASDEPAFDKAVGPDDDAADPVARARAKKSPNAFRTISEVADELHIAQHVLRFWETKFGQVRPLKRGGGRRYYRPDDIALLKRIADLLYFQGYTIKGVQRLLREGGGRLSDDIGPPTPDDHDQDGAAEPRDDRPPEPELPMPGLAASPGADPTTARPRPPRRVAGAEVAGEPEAGEPIPTASGAAGAGRVAALEGLLREVLEELRALRALLP